MRRKLVALMLLAAVAVFAADAYNTGIQAYNKGDTETAENVLKGYVDGGGTKSMAFIVLGQIEKKRGEHAKSADYYEKAAQFGKVKNRNTGLRCLLYALTKSWSPQVIPRGDKAMKALEKEYPKDGDAKVAVAYWANRRGYELRKLEKYDDAMPWFEKAVGARPDFPLFANNLAVGLCERAEKMDGQKAKDMAHAAVEVLKRWEGKPDPKLDATRARAVKLMNR